ncbi:phosphatidylserine decarboxylase [Shouchella patagoniensis]|uniref:phosphatidylserine decarboxylase n=1 Tax=Shouchella patagoniensis TaxID=228576 RepID=UPI00099574FF|nr:phosphatidylserine decarboxylase [Shouchella patagoniensis]
MKKKMFRVCIELTNHKWSSALLKRFAMSKISRPFNPLFVKTYQVNMDESARSLDSFDNLHTLFTRKLKVESRPIAPGDRTVVAPVDGQCSEHGILVEGQKFLVKGQSYLLHEMLQSKEEAKKFENGYYMVFYLSPAHYHRIHSPFNAICKSVKTAGNKSYPVNHLGLTYGKKPLSHNYRQITKLEMLSGICTMIEVGAMNINSIVRIKTDKKWLKGEETGYFSFGSTVVLLFEQGSFQPTLNVDEVKMGEKIGEMVDEKVKNACGTFP